ncbi:hypothetical protein A4H02_05525 [Fervidobacterium thailandense]|uniref:Uncharacterized protein n=1 Tax=Fervidobacterium thailandense TaxID=1008305 RepID=A0A1E3G2M8_9BACT|nr:hypothetical protein A4H02_05525 [Fervidobacterium thailandense]
MGTSAKKLLELSAVGPFIGKQNANSSEQSVKLFVKKIHEIAMMMYLKLPQKSTYLWIVKSGLEFFTALSIIN